MLDFHNVRMLKKPKELNFSKNTCGIRDVFEDIVYLLDCNLFSRTCIICRADNTVATFSYHFLDSISVSFTVLCEEIYIYGLKMKETT